MPELTLTLADVERLERMVERRSELLDRLLRADPDADCEPLHDAIGEVTTALRDALRDDGPALLALAREALERRADRDLQAQADMARADWLEDERRHD